MNRKDIHVGDFVRVREWEDMESEFGTAGQGFIDCALPFFRNMRYLCGKTLTVESIEYEDNIEVVLIHSAEGYERGCHPENPVNISWCIVPDMVEPVFDRDTLDESYEPLSMDELRRLLSSEADEVNNGL